jgi:hypothetical protein
MSEVREEDEELYRLVMCTEHECAVCAEKICFTDELVVITVVTMVAGEQGVVYEPLRADDGDYMYEPRFLEFTCWEETVDEIGAQTDDTPPVEDDFAAVRCRTCSSGIRLGEVMGLATKGELLCSPRMPDGVQTTTWDAQDPQPDPICIGCLKLMSDELVDLWESVEQNDECEEGTTIRCWRHGCPGKSGCIMRRG